MTFHSRSPKVNFHKTVVTCQTQVVATAVTQNPQASLAFGQLSIHVSLLVQNPAQEHMVDLLFYVPWSHLF